MVPTADQPRRPRSIEVLGRGTCEDTAIAMSRLSALGVPFAYGDADLDPVVAGRIRALNDGQIVTPTVLVDREGPVAVEPTVEEIDALVVAAGHPAQPAVATQLQWPLTEAVIPLRGVPAPGLFGSPARSRWTSRQLTLFFAHEGRCLACYGYARQLVRQATALAEADATVAIIVPDAGAPEHWDPTHLEGTTVLVDEGSAWRRDVAAAIRAPDTGALVVILDRHLAPRAVSAADDAGGLVAPSEVAAWHRFIVLDCPECAGELPWS